MEVGPWLTCTPTLTEAQKSSAGVKFSVNVFIVLTAHPGPIFFHPSLSFQTERLIMLQAKCLLDQLTASGSLFPMAESEEAAPVNFSIFIG